VVFSDVPVRLEPIKKYVDAWYHFFAIKEARSGRDKTDIEAESSFIAEAKAALFEHLYANLSILDVKAGVLLTSTSIFTAILTLAALQTWISFGAVLRLWVVVDLIVSAVSVLFVLLVVYVRWSEADELETSTLDSLVEELVAIRNRRTRNYRIGYLLHYAVIVSSICILVFKVVGAVLERNGMPIQAL
jgi:hypothetical protein